MKNQQRTTTYALRVCNKVSRSKAPSLNVAVFLGIFMLLVRQGLNVIELKAFVASAYARNLL